MSESELTPARKRQFVIGAFMMLLVIVLALAVAFNGERIYMTSQGFFETCSPVGEDMVCQYCKCPNGAKGSAGFGGGICENDEKPYCMSAE